MRELVGLATRKAAFDRLGVKVFGLAVQDPKELEELQERLGTAVTLLADPDAVAVRAFGMVDPDPFPDRLMARAGSFWVDRDGRIRHRWLPSSYRERPDPDEVLATLRGR